MAGMDSIRCRHNGKRMLESGSRTHAKIALAAFALALALLSGCGGGGGSDGGAVTPPPGSSQPPPAPPPPSDPPPAPPPPSDPPPAPPPPSDPPPAPPPPSDPPPAPPPPDIDFTVVSGSVIGFDPTRPLLVTLSSIEDQSFIRSQTADAAGGFRFQGLEPELTYAVTVDQTGYRFLGDADLTAALFAVSGPGLHDIGWPSAEAMEPNSLQTVTVRPGDNPVLHGFPVAGLESNRFHFLWEEDATVSGYEYSSYINEPLDIEIIGAEAPMADNNAAVQLIQRYGVILKDRDVPWTSEYAHRLRETIDRLMLEENSLSLPLFQNLANQRSHWTLVDRELPGDIAIQVVSSGLSLVEISTAAFAYASPMIARVDGKKGRFFSNRLFRAVLRFVTDDGRDIDMAARILRTLYGVRIDIDGNFGGLYSTVPALEQDRSPASWQLFKTEELIALIAMLEEFPPGMRDISLPNNTGGLRYLLRRLDGQPHPIYNEAAAVAWSCCDHVEFMESAFASSYIKDLHRIVLHEKAHFIWAHVVSPELRYRWLKMSGWYRTGPEVDGNCSAWQADPENWAPPNVDPADLRELMDGPHEHDPAIGEPQPAEGWASCSTTQFVSAYAALMNPDEDFAESVTFFLNNPELLRSRALPKYDFIRDYIMQGNLYVSEVRPDLEFEVLNLYPDYIYPGKIRRIEIEVTGEPEEDKTVNIAVDIHLQACSENTNTGCFDSADRIGFRLFTPIGTYFDVGIHADPTGRIFRGSFQIPATAPAGWYAPEGIVVVDRSENWRLEKLSSGDFGWKLFVNNVRPDTTPPEFIAGTLGLSLLLPGDPRARTDLQADEREILASWQVREPDSPPVHCGGSLAHGGTPDGFIAASQAEGRTALELEVDGYATHECQTGWLVTRYQPSGSYFLSYLAQQDGVWNHSDEYFAHDHPTYAPPVEVSILNPFEDVRSPRLNIARCLTDFDEEECLRVRAWPTRPEAPDGETVVQVSYWAWDEAPQDSASGVFLAQFFLRNPLGQEFGFTQNTFEIQGDRSYFRCPAEVLAIDPSCDATTPVRYVWETVLPQGSAPGIWGLVAASIEDRVRNVSRFNFTEELRFEIDP